MRIVVCGGRRFADVDRLNAVLASLGRIDELAAGGATGADELARRWAVDAQLDHRIYPAQWRRFGKAAGPVRNDHMLEAFGPDLVVALPGGTGTAHMAGIAEARGLQVVRG